jgi:hypothetical protein
MDSQQAADNYALARLMFVNISTLGRTFRRGRNDDFSAFFFSPGRALDDFVANTPYHSDSC